VIADAPPALLDLVVEKDPQSETQTISRKTQAIINADRAIYGSAKCSRGERAWAEVALDAECNILESTPKGSRNEQLNRSAFNLGQIVGGGALSGSEVIDALLEARCDGVDQGGWQQGLHGHNQFRLNKGQDQAAPLSED
jgi:hypothetical protein